VHSRPKAAIARGLREEEGWLLPHLGDELVEIVGRRRAGARLDPHRFRRVGEQPVLLVVDELALLTLLHLFDQKAQLLLNLIEGMAVEVGHARLHVENGGHRVEEVLARGLLVVDEGLGQVRITVARRAAFDVGGRRGGRPARLLHPVEAVYAGLDRRPGQKRNQPARGDTAPLRARLGGVRELPCRAFG